MTDSRDKPEIETLDYKAQNHSISCECLACETLKRAVGRSYRPVSAPSAGLGFNSAVIKPETRVNKAEDAEQHLEEPKCRLCNDKKEIVRTFTGSIGLETAWRPKGSSTSREDETKACPNCTCTEQPNKNLMIITEIEGLLSQANEKISSLNVSGKNRMLIDSKVLNLAQTASEEIDLFQKTTLFELRKAFE